MMLMCDITVRFVHVKDLDLQVCIFITEIFGGSVKFSECDRKMGKPASKR